MNTSIPDFIKSELHLLTLIEAEQLAEQYPETVIYSKHLTEQGKMLVEYESVREGLADPERYGSLWLQTDHQLYRLDPDLQITV